MSTDEMGYQQFLNWATGYLVIELGSGTPLKKIIDTIINCVLSNGVFGGQK